MALAIPQAEPGISAKALYKKVGFAPHSPGQAEYLYSTTRFNIPCCGRRYGKSQVAGHRMTYKSFVPDSYNWIVAPSYRLGEKEFRVVYDDYRKLDLLRHCKKSYSPHQGDMHIDTPWNSHIMVVSAERPDNLLGEGLSHVIMSEAAKHSWATWETYIEPALSDLLGSCDFPSTPKGFNWYHGLWELGRRGGNEQYKSWQFPTWENVVRYPGGFDDPEIQRIKKVASPLWFAQEYGASFTAMSGSIYEEWNESIHVQPHRFRADWPNYLGFDYGFSNPFVCLDIQVGPDDTCYVWREYYERYKSTYEHGKILQEREQPPGYHIDGMWGDLRGPDEAATLALSGLGFVGSVDVPWKHGVEQIKRMLKTVDDDGNAVTPKLFVDPSCVNTIREISQLHVKEQINAKTDLNEQVGDKNIQHKIDDHAPDALRYFIGPYYVLGAGSHLEDVYGNNYRGSESEEFFTLNSQITMDTGISLGKAIGF